MRRKWGATNGLWGGHSAPASSGSLAATAEASATPPSQLGPRAPPTLRSVTPALGEVTAVGGLWGQDVSCCK